MAATGDEIGDDEYVTQYVFNDEPRNVPRPQDSDGLSALRGRHDVGQAAAFVRSKGLVYEGDDVRHAQVGELRAAGFVVEHTPTRRIAIHVSISRAAQWSHSDAMQFEQCFERG